MIIRRNRKLRLLPLTRTFLFRTSLWLLNPCLILLFFRSRQPDFLLDILQRQGTNQAMPWLADLVESAEGSLSVLPVQCLCEFLLNDSLPLVESGENSETRWNPVYCSWSTNPPPLIFSCFMLILGYVRLAPQGLEIGYVENY